MQPPRCMDIIFIISITINYKIPTYLFYCPNWKGEGVMMVRAKEKCVVLKKGMQLFNAYVIPPPKKKYK